MRPRKDGAGMARENNPNTVAAHLTDQELVRQVRQGTMAAFDKLVARHRAAVLHAAYALLGDWDLAEDAVQQTFVQAFRGLPGLRDAEKFRPWLMTIMRRFTTRIRASAQSSLLEFTDAFILPSYRQDTALDELFERIHAGLADLSARSRQVITLHYLDGYSCQEIGERLCLTTGTVKRILHESRNSLRQRIGLAPHPVRKGDSMPEKMTGQHPRVLEWWISGSVPPDGGRRSLLTKAVYLAINKDPLTPAEIARAVKADEFYIRDLLPGEVEEEFIRALPDERYQANFIALEAREWEELTAIALQHGNTVAGLIQDRLDELQTSWQHTTWPAQGFSWEEVGRWSAVSLFIHNTFTRETPVPPVPPFLPVPPLRHSGYRYWGAGREVPSPDVWRAGYNGRGTPGITYTFGYLDITALPRLTLQFTPENARTLAALADGIATPETIAEQMLMPIEIVRDVLGRVSRGRPGQKGG